MAAVHPFPEIWTPPYLGKGTNAVKGGKLMSMDLVSLSFWSHYYSVCLNCRID